MKGALLWALLGCNREPLPPVVALVTIDTWRADHFDAEHTPHLWRFATQGTRFTRAYSPIGLTTPSHATMWTGLMPWEHGLEGNNHHGFSLRADVPLVMDDFEGWARGAFVSAYPAGPAGGMDRGWDVFSGPSLGERPGEEAVKEALEWLPRDRPALLWVHLYEPHGPYEGKGESDRARYAEEVRKADEALRPLLDVLEERAVRLVVTSDHGEVLDEETCGRQHERSISEHVLRVPLFVWTPDGTAEVVDDLVGLADVPKLLRGEPVQARRVWFAESGMCESDCAPGCAPIGLTGRDRVAIGRDGRSIHRPGRGTWSEGQFDLSWAPLLEAIPPVEEQEAKHQDSLEALGYH